MTERSQDGWRRSTRAVAAETKLRLEHIIASAMDAIITVDDDQVIVLFNPAAERMFGVPAERALAAA